MGDKEIDPGEFVLCLNVKDLGRSLEFYRRLGLEQIGGVPDEGWAILGRRNLKLGLFEGHIEKNLLNFRGGDVFALARELESRGLTILRGPERESDGSAGAWLADPDDNLIYFNTCPDEEAGGA
ncbi:MAG: VOC family protein [Candidatus Zixiibacteriota bacterium]|jgi:catechol 2,3-dioxygenase-like lactoylglutathione lyase family enzyme